MVKNNYKILIIIVFILINLNAISQNKINNGSYIRELEVINTNLFSTLDTIISMKEDIQYFKDSKFFLIEFDEDTIKPDLIFIRAYEKIEYRYPNIVGYFYYKEHYFIIKGDSVNSEIFQKTDNIKHFDYGLPSQKYTKKGKPIINQNEVFIVWSLRYRNGKFKILSYFTDNKKDKWFNIIEDKYRE